MVIGLLRVVGPSSTQESSAAGVNTPPDGMMSASSCAGAVDATSVAGMSGAGGTGLAVSRLRAAVVASTHTGFGVVSTAAPSAPRNSSCWRQA
jgi:hypothetical protein